MRPKLVLMAPPLARVRQGYGRLPNLAVASLAAAAAGAGFRATALDRQATAAAPRELVGELLAHAPDVVAFTVCDDSLGLVAEIAARLRRLFHGLIVVGGPTAARYPDLILGRLPAVDAVVPGDGLPVLPALLQALAAGRGPETVPGMACRVAGRFRRNPAGPTAPKPWRLPRWWPESDDATPLLVRPPGQGRRRPREVVSEMAEGIAQGAGRFVFYDRLPLAGEDDRAWARRFLDELERRDLGASLVMHLEVSDVLAGRDLLPALRSAGLTHLSIGVESLLPRHLALYRPGVDAAAAQAAVEAAGGIGLELWAPLCFWDPWTTLAEAVDHVRRLEESGLTRQSITASLPPWTTRWPAGRGTRLGRLLRRRARRPRDWEPEWEPAHRATARFVGDPLERFARCTASLPRLPPLTIQVHDLEKEGRASEALALRGWARDLAAAELAYFRALLVAAREGGDDEDLEEIHRLRGAELREVTVLPPAAADEVRLRSESTRPLRHLARGPHPFRAAVGAGARPSPVMELCRR